MNNRYYHPPTATKSVVNQCVRPVSKPRPTWVGGPHAARRLRSAVLLSLLVLAWPVVYAASIGFEVAEGWVVGQPPPAGSGCTLTTGYGPDPGVYAGAEGQSLAIPNSAVARFAISMPATGVQHLSVDLTFTSPPYTTGFFRDWRGLDFGYLQLLDVSGTLAGINLSFDAAAWNSAPTSYMNNEDLIVKALFYGGQQFTTPFASPASYHFDFAFDYGNNKTTFTMFATGGTTPLATHTWNGTFQVGAMKIMSRAWYPDTPVQGTTTYVDNLFVGAQTTPTTLSVTSSGTPSAVGAPVTFTALVSGSAPTGTVTFYDGATALGSGALDATAQATLTTSSLARGTHTITAQYGGDANNSASTSPPLTQEVLTPYTLVVTASPAAGGEVTPGGTYPEGSTQTIAATAQPGWQFDGWTGDATGAANPLSVLMDGSKTIAANFSHDMRDSDSDGLNNYDEVVTHHTNPALKDTDGDGFDDGFEVNAGYDPALATSTPEGTTTIRTAVEFRFNAALGVSYRIEASTDFENWTTVEPAITGQGAVITRFYSTENQPRRYFRPVRN